MGPGSAGLVDVVRPKRCECFTDACHLLACKNCRSSIYIHGQLDVRWPVWCEYLAVFIGLVLGVDGGRRGDLLFASIGFVMMYGHVRKLLHPSSSYYT